MMGQVPLLNTCTTAASFYAAEKHGWFRLKLNICLRVGIKLPEQPFRIKSGISSSPTDLEGFSVLLALQAVASKIGVRNYNL
jgi:hypothetical protein